MVLKTKWKIFVAKTDPRCWGVDAFDDSIGYHCDKIILSPEWRLQGKQFDFETITTKQGDIRHVVTFLGSVSFDKERKTVTIS